MPSHSKHHADTRILKLRLAAASSALMPLLRDESGQDIIEYALVAALVGLASVISVEGVSNKIGNTFKNIGDQLTNATA